MELNAGAVCYPASHLGTYYVGLFILYDKMYYNCYNKIAKNNNGIF